ncbi:MAG TPA: hypothetical protein VFE39_16915 [Pseudonocardia sp.]|nr:hypothetical protein [Pseudonocardia sp.]
MTERAHEVRGPLALGVAVGVALRALSDLTPAAAGVRDGRLKVLLRASLALSTTREL